MTSVSSSILTALGAGSGIDTASLVSSLVSATKEPRQAAITNRQTLNSARISALASASSSLDTFADALNSLLAGTGYSGTPASNDPSIASVSALPGGTPTGLPAQIEVRQLAASRTLVSAVNANQDAAQGAAATVGIGELSLKVGNGNPVSITITAANNSFTGLAAAINGSGAGVTATVVTDSQGTRLMLKGPTGAANDFSLTTVSSTTDGTTGADLSQFAFSATTPPVGSRMSSATEPKDAVILLDGVEQHYAGNTIDGAIPYLRIDLNKAAPGTNVTLATTEPTTSMRDLLVEFVDAYNTLMKALNTATSTGTDQSNAGVLNGESSIRDMKRQLSQMVSAELGGTGAYRTLNDLGVSTNRDGTLSLDTKALDKAIAADPKAITQLLNPSVRTATNIGLAGLMDSVRDNIKKDGGPLAATQGKYEKLAKELADQLDKLDMQMTNYQEQLTKVYSAMETRLSALKATQSYLQQQVALWTKNDN
ncbi:flagellar hook protein [Sphingobium indicum]|uniref:Flagellar hook-associated protein 2 n=2 Tax=Sphingobium indicum TaxID=332055 RepID=A0A1L5BQX3_SPHIB|nr:flagellar filament capping protein FliD [Sphingobium indicum]APL95273.1 flagellar hook protein [Sphingobium indicum B90A]KEY99891.1 flagellar hook protein [Sphingomonas sp. BHC-A]RYM02630.1 flagellar hook protein [Sphingobium indicum]